ncbi:MAG: LTA synthase family protein, partial [Candidatus Ornithomonoglobus sp.]
MIKRNHAVKIVITIILALFFWTFTCINVELFKVYTDEEVFMLGYFISSLVCSLVICFLGVTKFRLNKAASAITGALVYIVAIFGAMQISISFAGGFQAKPYLYFINVLFWLAFGAIGLLVSGSLRVSAITALSASYLFNASSFIVYCLRGTALMPTDIYAWGTAMNVAAQYEFEMKYPMITSTALAVALIMLAFKFPVKLRFKGKPFIMRSIGAVALAISLAIITTGDYSQIDVSVYDQSLANYNFGSALSFYINSTKMGLAKSDTYNPEKLDEKLLSYVQPEAADIPTPMPEAETVPAEGDDTEAMPAETVAEPESTAAPETGETMKTTMNETGEKPNIIVVMNESFCDPAVVGDFDTNEDYMPFFRGLENNTIKGELLVSPFGGYTCNTEYEFLTGMSTGVLKSRSAPYIQNIFGKLPYSLPMHMRELGYKAIALHPFSADSWNRVNVYKDLSFDEFISMENFATLSEYPEYLRGYVSDKGNYGAIINYFLGKDPNERAFIFNITMQNHGGYTNKSYKNSIFLQNMSGDYPQAEQYLSLIKDSDDALKYFLNELKKFDEPIIVVMFGDHMPNIETGFYEELYGKPLSGISYEEALDRYRIPFIIWANYDIEEETGILSSPCFLSNKIMEVAQLPKSRVQLYLDELQQNVIQINPAVYTDPSGVHHMHSELPEQLGEYYDMQ